MSNYFKILPRLTIIGGFILVIIVALIVIFGGEFSANGNKEGGSISIKGRKHQTEQTLPEQKQNKVGCLPGEENSQPIDCDNQ